MIVRVGSGVTGMGAADLRARDDMGWSPCDATVRPSQVALVTPSYRARNYPTRSPEASPVITSDMKRPVNGARMWALHLLVVQCGSPGARWDAVRDG